MSEKTISDWQEDCHSTAVRKGWWDDQGAEEREAARALAAIALEHAALSARVEAIREFGVCDDDRRRIIDFDIGRLPYAKVDDLSKMALVHSEVTEAVECIIDDDLNQSGGRGTKPEGAVVELADVVIRILDWCGRKGLQLDQALRDKARYNDTRPRRHGNKLA